MLTTYTEMKMVCAMMVPKTWEMTSDKEQVYNNLLDKTEAEQNFPDSGTCIFKNK
jgi:hypothetical protein